MMNFCSKLKIVFPILFLFCLHTLSATVLTWTGANGNPYWADESNWTPKQVPSSKDEVIIPSNSGDVIIHDDEWNIMQLTINDNSRLLIYQDAVLSVEGSQDFGIAVYDGGVLENDGGLQVLKAATEGIQVGGTFTNRGECLIAYSESIGLHLAGNGKVVNDRNATIYFYPNGGHSLEILYPSHLQNDGNLRFEEQDTGVGVLVTGTWNNRLNSGTYFEPGYRGELLLTLGGTLFNSGQMQFESTSSTNLIRIEEGRFLNRRQGVVAINPRSNNSFGSFFINFLGELNNKGNIAIDLRSGSQRGIFVRGKLINRSSGDISVRDGREGINNFAAAGDFINEGEIGIYSVFPFGLLNTGFVENKGTLILDEISTFENGASGQLINDGGTMIFGDAQPTLLLNNGTITNRLCSEMQFFGPFTNGGTVNNDGHLLLDPRGFGATASSGIINNYGVLNDPEDQWENGTNNQGIRLIPVSNNYGGNVYYDVIDMASASGFYITRGRWYLDAGLQNMAGVYSLAQNTFTGFNGNGTNTLYAEVSNYSGGCIMVVPIRFLGYLPSITENNPLQFAEARSAAKTTNPTSFKVYPNPSNGLVNLQPAPAWEGLLQVRLIDGNGRLVWQEQKAASDWNTLSWNKQINSGVYQVQIWQAGHLLGQEKLVLFQP